MLQIGSGAGVCKPRAILAACCSQHGARPRRNTAGKGVQSGLRMGCGPASGGAARRLCRIDIQCPPGRASSHCGPGTWSGPEGSSHNRFPQVPRVRLVPPFFRGRNTSAVAFAALAAAVCPLASSVPPGHPSGSWFPGASRPVPVPAPSSRWHLAPGKPRVSVLPFWRLSPPKTRCKHNPLIRYWPASGGRMISIRWSARTRSCARCATRSTISGCIMPTC